MFEQHWFGSCGSLEDSSFQLFENVGPANIYMTNDWLDFCVEHLSHYIKGVPLHVLSNFRSVFSKFNNYLTNTRQIEKKQGSPFYSTLAILPMYLTSGDNMCGSDVPLEQLIEHEKDREQCLYMYALSATLTSLWQAGIRRVIIPMNVVDSPPVVQEAIKIFRSSGIGRAESIMEIIPVNVTEGINSDVFPCNALDQLKLALTGHMQEPELSRWIGPSDQHDQWKFIYFSEPDLVLHTRSSSIRRLTESIEDGKIIAAHRFQPMLHVVDFPDDNVDVLYKYIPNYANFSDFIDLDVQAVDSCCDAGNWWPGPDDFPTCGRFYHSCGFYRNPLNIEQASRFHERLFPYPRVRLIDGMNVLSVQEHGRVCIPRKGGNCNDS